ncbi:cardiolipin synthase [Rhodopirellula sp. JC740]|uniref:Cardiolipin synthase n=1 Tax=Rhodopirellula halodulae TaxID=2894198 RepID=A0ABS8NLD3_9BACT|nr:MULTISPECIES: cardiolipin synthase [unclassified Rhodopirellula]MCC9643618.1 cardiolipin synthase [Rhodopirellula sp. JC740]MCC9656771.1 cardiolipin synthase [Rhodopirellula sp. JC737]
MNLEKYFQFHVDAISIGLVIHVAIEVVTLTRVMTRPHREPASRIAWVTIIAAIPFLGVFLYFLFGETNIGSRRMQRMKGVMERLPSMPEINADESRHTLANVPDRYQHLFRMGESVNGFEALGGNRGVLMKDSNDTIESIVNDIDHATDHVHLLFYIWLPDNNGTRIKDALIRAAKRGVRCRAMADDLGSRGIIRSQHWQQMREAGVHLSRALPIGNLVLRALRGRIDLRNHRKIVVIDGSITYCGSQNCADPEFRVKPKYAPWVDAMIRFEGPVVRQNQQLFIADWMAGEDDDLTCLLEGPLPNIGMGFPAQVIGTGPTVRNSAMPEVFETLFHTARRKLTITSPYYVPNESMQQALCAAAWRGVETNLILPARNDSRIVGGASRSYYAGLLESGIQIHEYTKGLLHTKSVTVDDEITLIGSANMDRRSFDLNYENNILFYDPKLTGDVYQRQQEYLADSQPVTAEQVQSWSLPQRLWNNVLATLGPVL